MSSADKANGDNAEGPRGDHGPKDDEKRMEYLLRLDRDAVDLSGGAGRPWMNVTKLNLPNQKLTSLPDDFPSAVPNISILFLSKNEFTQVPALIGQCPALQMVAFKENKVTTIHPEALQPQLRWLILTNNQIQELPDSIGRCTKLQKCMLSGNLLERLPESMKNCTNLELIRLASNRLQEPPMQVLQLPRLCWIALSDNPFLDKDTAAVFDPSKQQQQLPVIEDLDETLLLQTDSSSGGSPAGDVLGSGAGGVTRKMKWNERTVAVKTYSGTMTSDGLASSERKINTAVAAACTGGNDKHDCFVTVYGQTAQTQSLVMEYLEDFRALAGPPSFETCSRDVYDAEATRALFAAGGDSGDARALVVRVVTKLLAALMELHAKANISHGDFYAHNLLVSGRDASTVKLTDFGAAFFYPRNNSNDNSSSSPSYGRYIETIELRAFAVLVRELVALLHMEEEEESEEPSAWLAAQCWDEQQATTTTATTTFEAIDIWWKQKQLAAPAKQFDE